MLPPPQHEPGLGLLDDLISSCFYDRAGILDRAFSAVADGSKAALEALTTNGNGTHADRFRLLSARWPASLR